MGSEGYMACQNLKDFNFESVASAASIEKNKYPFATGYWVNLGSGTGEYTFTYGFTTTIDDAIMSDL